MATSGSVLFTPQALALLGSLIGQSSDQNTVTNTSGTNNSTLAGTTTGTNNQTTTGGNTQNTSLLGTTTGTNTGTTQNVGTTTNTGTSTNNTANTGSSTTQNIADVSGLRQVFAQQQAGITPEMLAAIFTEGAKAAPDLVSATANAVGARSANNTPLATALANLSSLLTGKAATMSQDMRNASGQTAAQIAQATSGTTTTNNTNSVVTGTNNATAVNNNTATTAGSNTSTTDQTTGMTGTNNQTVVGSNTGTSNQTNTGTTTGQTAVNNQLDTGANKSNIGKAIATALGVDAGGDILGQLTSVLNGTGPVASGLKNFLNSISGSGSTSLSGTALDEFLTSIGIDKSTVSLSPSDTSQLDALLNELGVSTSPVSPGGVIKSEPLAGEPSEFLDLYGNVSVSTGVDATSGNISMNDPTNGQDADWWVTEGWADEFAGFEGP